jgi:pyruvate-ferredoxin/flavodoxin oxidoreductase
MAEGLIKAGNGQRTVADLLAEIDAMPNLAPLTLEPADTTALATPPTAPAAPLARGPASPESALAEQDTATAVADEDEEEEIALGPWIDTARCTTCDECTNINNRMFAYNEKKQAYIKDARAGTFKELVQSAEKCPVQIIHPGTPLNPKEKGLEKWLKRAEPFA